MDDIFEVTMKKIQPNSLSISHLVVAFKGIPRDQVAEKAMEIANQLGLVFEMSYIIKGFKE